MLKQEIFSWKKKSFYSFIGIYLNLPLTWTITLTGSVCHCAQTNRKLAENVPCTEAIVLRSVCSIKSHHTNRLKLFAHWSHYFNPVSNHWCSILTQMSVNINSTALLMESALFALFQTLLFPTILHFYELKKPPSLRHQRPDISFKIWTSVFWENDDKNVM